MRLHIGIEIEKNTEIAYNVDGLNLAISKFQALCAYVMVELHENSDFDGLRRSLLIAIQSATASIQERTLPFRAAQSDERQ